MSGRRGSHDGSARGADTRVSPVLQVGPDRHCGCHAVRRRAAACTWGARVRARAWCRYYALTLMQRVLGTPQSAVEFVGVRPLRRERMFRVQELTHRAHGGGGGSGDAAFAV